MEDDRDDKQLRLVVPLGTPFSPPIHTIGKVYYTRETISWWEMLGTAMSKACNCVTSSYMQQGFSTTAPFLEEGSEASLLQYFI